MRTHPVNTFRYKSPAFALDGQGNVYVSGQTQAGGNVPRRDFLTIKYSSTGTLLWSRTYPGSTNNSEADTAIAADAAGNVWVAGESAPPTSSGWDGQATIKYDPDGTPLWVRRLDDLVGYRREVSAVLLDTMGNAIVTGTSRRVGVGFFWDFLTVKYSSSGDALWQQRHEGLDGDDYLMDSALDSDGNAILMANWTVPPYSVVFGSELVKYTSSGNVAWTDRWERLGFALALALDGAGNAYVAEVPEGFGELRVRCYSPTGALVRVFSYAAFPSTEAIPRSGISPKAMQIDASGNVYVTGAIGNSVRKGQSFEEWNDGITLKFDPNGSLLWAARYHGPDGVTAEFQTLALDEAGNVHVSGGTTRRGTGGLFTVSYGTNGNQLWAVFQAGTSGPAALAVNNSSNVYVTRVARDPDGAGLLTTTKYIPAPVADQPTALVTPPPAQPYVGFNVTLSASAAGPGPFTYQWRFLGRPLANETNATLVLTNIQLAQQGDYSVIVSNAADYSISPETRLLLLLPAAFLVQPADQFSVVGDDSIVTASAFGTEPLSYQWHFNGTPLMGATSNVFTLHSVQPANVGDYTLVVTNPGASVTSRVARLVVIPPPTATNPEEMSIISENMANPYPSTITITGATGTVARVLVTLYGISHDAAADIDMLLQGPGGQAVMLMSDAGGYAEYETLTFDDDAASGLPIFPNDLGTGAYKPTNYETNDFLPPPAPPPPYGVSLSVFNGTDPNGVWRLFVVDDTEEDDGDIGGWSLTLIGAGVATPCLQPLLQGKWPGFAVGVTVVGHYAYVAGGGAGLQVIDVSNPANCVRVGGYRTPDSVQAVAVSGNYAYAGDEEEGLVVIDVRNPTNCVRVGGYASDGAEGVAVSGNYAYVAAGYSGLHVIDVTDATNCVRIGGYDTSGIAVHVAVAGNYAYVADYWDGLQVIDVSDPANCVRVGGYDTSGESDGVAVLGNYAYVAYREAGLVVIDVSNPTNCVRVSGLETGGLAEAVSVSGNYAYLADYTNGLQVIDVSNPTNCVRVGGYDTSGLAFGVAVVAGRIYVADADGGLLVLPTVPNVQFTVRVDATPSVPFTLEAATNLLAPIPWTPIFTTNVPTMPFDYVDFDVKIAEKPQKYYRVRQP